MLIIILVVSEIQYYTATELKFDYEVDTNLTRKVKINIDMTVAMKCQHMGADVLDQTGQDVFSYGKLKEEPAYFQLSPRQQEYLDFTQQRVKGNDHAPTSGSQILPSDFQTVVQFIELVVDQNSEGLKDLCGWMGVTL
nr:hypothetical protein BaRGS_033549 [Batillaria attramentaria]